MPNPRLDGARDQPSEGDPDAEPQHRHLNPRERTQPRLPAGQRPAPSAHPPGAGRRAHPRPDQRPWTPDQCRSSPRRRRLRPRRRGVYRLVTSDESRTSTLESQWAKQSPSRPVSACCHTEARGSADTLAWQPAAAESLRASMRCQGDRKGVEDAGHRGSRCREAEPVSTGESEKQPASRRSRGPARPTFVHVFSERFAGMALRAYPDNCLRSRCCQVISASENFSRAS
jgi:hypothetical protein